MSERSLSNFSRFVHHTLRYEQFISIGIWYWLSTAAIASTSKYSDVFFWHIWPINLILSWYLWIALMYAWVTFSRFHVYVCGWQTSIQKSLSLPWISKQQFPSSSKRSHSTPNITSTSLWTFTRLLMVVLRTFNANHSASSNAWLWSVIAIFFIQTFPAYWTISSIVLNPSE